jgi:hypothetical protein
VAAGTKTRVAVVVTSAGIANTLAVTSAAGRFLRWVRFQAEWEYYLPTDV